MTLNPVQARVLGALIEKEIATPEIYPLSLNALGNACNQRSSRDPVMDLTEEDVRQALHALEDIGLVSPVRDGRVPKYENHARTVFNLRRDETAVLCLLLLRGPQTPGELRSRADRLYAFDGLDAVESTLRRLAERPAPADPSQPAPEPLVTQLARQPGAREARWAQLLTGPPPQQDRTPATGWSSGEAPQPGPAGRGMGAEALDRLTALEAEVARLTEVVARLEGQLGVPDRES